MERDQIRRSGPRGARVLAVLLALALTVSAVPPALAESGSGSSGAGSSGGSGGSSGNTSTRGTFALSVNLQPPAVGYLVRGGLRLAACTICTTDVEPRYVGLSFGRLFYDSNSIGLVSLQDFQGTVTLEVLDLPPGVTSRTASSAVVPRRAAISVPLRLEAAADAPLGEATITLRATAGSTVKTLALPISVVDQMPTG